jgi:uncharacterized NAD(P)/FAD-binding protein YdhS
MTKTIAIIGGGFSGTLTAVHLLRSHGCDLHVVLINRSGPLARGVAYGTRTEAHVLNVPAGRMGAFADDEQHFLRYVRARDANVGSGDFLPRRLYGEYLEWLLEDAVTHRAPGLRFSHRIGHVVDIEPAADRRARLVFADGGTLQADRVVLALGNFAPADPPLADGAFYRDCARYVSDPWAAGALERVDLQRPVLLIGTGLTAVDIAIDLAERGLRQPMLALSRRGLAPLAHRGHAEVGENIALPEALRSGPAAVGHYLHTVRRHARACAAQGIDWREVIAALRPLTPLLWQRLDRRERARFLRHVQPYWEVHRHRLAPQLARQFAALVDSGQLRLRAGRIRQLAQRGDWIEVTFRPRGARANETAIVGSAINCTGPNSNMRRLQEPLLTALNRRGLLCQDALGLGMAITDDYALVGGDGSVSATIHYVGPLLKAHFWEATAVPELRQHVQTLTRLLLQSLSR